MRTSAAVTAASATTAARAAAGSVCAAGDEAGGLLGGGALVQGGAVEPGELAEHRHGGAVVATGHPTGAGTVDATEALARHVEAVGSKAAAAATSDGAIRGAPAPEPYV